MSSAEKEKAALARTLALAMFSGETTEASTPTFPARLSQWWICRSSPSLHATHSCTRSPDGVLNSDSAEASTVASHQAQAAGWLRRSVSCMMAFMSFASSISATASSYRSRNIASRGVGGLRPGRCGERRLGLVGGGPVPSVAALRRAAAALAVLCCFSHSSSCRYHSCCW